jgi:GxxExxY protein
MSTDKILEKELSDKIIRCAFNVHNALGYGFLENVYENSLVIELQEAGLAVKAQHPIPVYYKSQLVGNYKADVLVEDKIILELKAEKEFHSVHEAQLLNYLKATGIKIGYLINFGKSRVEFKRFVF